MKALFDKAEQEMKAALRATCMRFSARVLRALADELDAGSAPVVNAEPVAVNELPPLPPAPSSLLHEPVLPSAPPFEKGFSQWKKSRPLRKGYAMCSSCKTVRQERRMVGDKCQSCVDDAEYVITQLPPACTDCEIVPSPIPTEPMNPHRRRTPTLLEREIDNKDRVAGLLTKPARLSGQEVDRIYGALYDSQNTRIWGIQLCLPVLGLPDDSRGEVKAIAIMHRLETAGLAEAVELPERAPGRVWRLKKRRDD